MSKIHEILSTLFAHQALAFLIIINSCLRMGMKSPSILLTSQIANQSPVSKLYLRFYSRGIPQWTSYDILVSKWRCISQTNTNLKPILLV